MLKKFKSLLLELSNIISKVLDWAEDFNDGEQDYRFDIDDKLFFLSEKHTKDFNSGDLFLTYSLLDFYCDAVKHGFKKIDHTSSVIESRNDIEQLNNHLKKNDYKIFDLPKELKEKLILIFRD